MRKRVGNVVGALEVSWKYLSVHLASSIALCFFLWDLESKVYRE